MTDHRVGITAPGIHRVLSGEVLGDIIEALIENDDTENLANFLQGLENKTSIHGVRKN